jgi:hypothetical protein
MNELRICGTPIRPMMKLRYEATAMIRRLIARPVDRKAALAAAALLETPDHAHARVAAGGAAPAHYIATPPAGAAPPAMNVANSYK